MRDLEDIKNRLRKAARGLVDIRGAGIGTADIATAAGLPPGVVAQAYGDVEALLCEVLGQMYEEARDFIAKLTFNMPAGPPRLRLALDSYLQALLDRPGLHALAVRLRFHPEGAAVVRRHVHGFKLMFQIELNSNGWPQAEAAARLGTAAIIEIALAETEAGQPLPELRETLIGYFGSAAA